MVEVCATDCASRIDCFSHDDAAHTDKRDGLKTYCSV